MKLSKVFFPLLALFGFLNSVNAQQLDLNGLTFGMSTEQAIQILGSSFKVARATRNDGVEQLILYKQDVGYALLAMAHRVYFISYGQAFPKGQELNKAKVEADLHSKFGETQLTWSKHFSGIEWGFDANERTIAWNAGCGGQMAGAFGMQGGPPELSNVHGLVLPASYATQGPSCPFSARADGRTDRENPELLTEISINLFDHRPLLAGYNQSQAAAQQQRQSDSKAAQQRKSPF